MLTAVKPIEWCNHSVRLLDQRLLPHREEYVDCRTVVEVAEAIREMVVRGAPAIGVAAAFGMVLAAVGISEPAAQQLALEEAAIVLKRSRPTAVNLAWAVEEMLSLAASARARLPDAAGLAKLLEHRAKEILAEDIAANRRIGRFGQELLSAKATVLTHCNAGALATAGYGTALGVVRGAIEAGKKVAVWADETRPWLQGARLTAWELQRDGIDVTVITDNMAGHFFQGGTFDAVIVGADRIAANGDTANKIGTYTLAVLANAHNVPFYIAAPWSTVDLDCPNGGSIPIEERSAEEVLEAKGADASGEIRSVRVAPTGVASRHPAFDVTPAKLITAIITDRGIARAPFEKSLEELASRRVDS